MNLPLELALEVLGAHHGLHVLGPQLRLSLRLELEGLQRVRQHALPPRLLRVLDPLRRRAPPRRTPPRWHRPRRSPASPLAAPGTWPFRAGAGAACASAAPCRRSPCSGRTPLEKTEFLWARSFSGQLGRTRVPTLGRVQVDRVSARVPALGRVRSAQRGHSGSP